MANMGHANNCAGPQNCSMSRAAAYGAVGFLAFVVMVIVLVRA